MLEDFLADRAIRGVCADTLKWYRSYLNPWIAILEPVDPLMRVRTYLNHFARGQTQKAAWTAIRQYETWKARKNGQYPWPLDMGRMRFAPPPRYEPLSEPELHRICAHLETLALNPRRAFAALRDKTLYAVLYYSIQRLEAIRRLRRADLDLDGNSLRARTKGGVEDDVFIPAPAVQALRQWMIYLPSHSEWVFPSSRLDKPIHESWVSHRLPVLAQAVGIRKRVWVHGLRHSGMTELGERGVPAEIVQQQALHKSISTTLRYMQISQRRVRSELRRAWG